MLSVGLATAASGQSFIGQSVTMGHYLPNTTTVFDGPYTVVAAAGVGDRQLLSPFADRHNGYGVNVESDRVIVDFIDTVAFTAGPSYHGLIISNLVTSGTASIIETAPHRIFSYDGSTLRLDWQNIIVPNGATYTIVFTPVPEPAAVGLFAVGALIAWRFLRFVR